MPAARAPEAVVAETTTRPYAQAAPISEETSAAVVSSAPGAAAVVTALAPERYKLQLPMSRATRDKLRRAQDLLRHAVPSGDAAEIVDRALTLLIEDAERRRIAATERPRTSRGRATGSRHIPAAVKHAVWKRDGGRCAFVCEARRCTETVFLEFHHVLPYSAGGAATEANISMRCRSHNRYEADLFFCGECVRERSEPWGNVWPEANSFLERVDAARSPAARTMRARRGGGTGRRSGLKIPWPSGRVGSIPTPGTNNNQAIPDCT